MGALPGSSVTKAARAVGIVVAALLSAATLTVGHDDASATSKRPDRYEVHGVAVKRYIPARPDGMPPVVMVHGGGFASWVFERHARALRRAGYTVHALDWFNHGESDALDEASFLRRGIEDVARREIRYVVGRLPRRPVLIGHSMGGLAALAYASQARVRRLILLTPVVPAAVGAEPIDLPVDFTEPFGPLPFEEAKPLFFTTLPDGLARKYHARMEPESPRAVFEATRWTVDVNVAAVRSPTLIFATELDLLTPPPAVHRLAELMGAQYELIPGIGHDDLLLKEPESTATARRIISWLRRRS